MDDDNDTCPRLAACENRTVAMVKNTIWTISTHTAAVLLLSELQKRLAGQPRAYMRHVVVAAATEYSPTKERYDE